MNLPVGAQVLLTFSGKFGDILWTLPAAKELKTRGTIIDFATMDRFSAVHGLIEQQPYIRHVMSLPMWVMEHDWCGAQPRIPPFVPDGYDATFHLTYWERPTKPLILHAYEVLGLEVSVPPLPFLLVDAAPQRDLVAYAFNDGFRGIKEARLRTLQGAIGPRVRWVDTTHLPFLEAARVIKSARFFVGCRSANYVVAHGVGQRILSIEPEHGRRDVIFSCPFGREVMPDPNDELAMITQARAWMEEP